MKKWAAIILALVILCWTPVVTFASGVNSENKRRSVVHVPPNPSGDINKDDRIHISTLYRFIVPASATNAGFLVEGNNMTYSYLFISVTDAAYDYAVHVTGTGNTFENCTFTMRMVLR